MNFQKGFPLLCLIGTLAVLFVACEPEQKKAPERSKRFEFRDAETIGFSHNNLYVIDHDTGREYLGVYQFGFLPLNPESTNPWINQK